MKSDSEKKHNKNGKNKDKKFTREDSARDEPKSDRSSSASQKKSDQIKMAVITGASSGIGLALAKQFAKNGSNLLIVGQSEDIYYTQECLEEEYEVQVTALRANLATFQGVEKLYQTIQMMRRSVDAIAVNAGIGVSGNFIYDTDLYDELDMINLNITSLVHLSKLVAWDMARRGRGRILFTSSVAALSPVSSMTVYSATKAFVLSFGEALRDDLKDTGVTVTVLLPKATDTDFFDRDTMDKEDEPDDSEKDDPDDVAEKAYEALIKGEDHVMIGSSEDLEDKGFITKFLTSQKQAKSAGGSAESKS